MADDTLSGKHSRSLYGPANDIALFVNNLLPGFAPGTIQAVVSAQGAPG